MPTKLQQKKREHFEAVRREKSASPVPQRAPLWARVIVYVVEVFIWALTLGYVKRITALERLLHHSPQWHERDRAEQSIKGAFRRLAQPLLRIETEFSQESGSDTTSVLTPRTATAYEETLRSRLHANARIRSCLRDIPLEKLEVPFLVNACTWNVDQQPPPVGEEAFQSWLLGYELHDELRHYQKHKQSVMAHGGAVPVISSPDATNTMRARKMSAAAAAANSGPLPGRTSEASSPGSAPKSSVGDDPMQTEWRWLEGKFPDLFLISLQEVEMTGTALVRESTQRRWEWTDAIIETLHAASERTIEYKKVQVVQLVGLVLIVLVQAKHVDYVSHVRLSLTRTGALSMLGNKGSVAMRATIYGKRFLFISAHFVAHSYNEKKRTSNYQAALKDIRFEMPVWFDDESEVLQTFMNAAQTSQQAVRNFSITGSSSWDRLFRFRNAAFQGSFSSAAEVRVLDEHDYVFFLGDLNSRLHALPGSNIRESVVQGEYDHLLCHDELRQLMVSGEGFDGFQEQWISFPPTYKFDRNTDVYDTSRKHRDPAWCDRVLFRVLESDEVANAKAEDGEGAEESSGLRSEEAWPAQRCRSSATHSPHASSGAGLQNGVSIGGGDWVSLEDLQQSILSQQSGAEVSHLSSSASSDYAGEDRSKAPSPDVEGHRGAATASVAALNGYDSPTLLRRKAQQSPLSALTNAVSHAVWEQKRCAPTFAAARRPRGTQPSSSPFAMRFPMVKNHINALEYAHVPALRQSDHRPVRARFEVKVIALDPTTVSEIIESVREVIEE